MSSSILSFVNTSSSHSFPQYQHIMPLTLSNVMPRKNIPLKEILFHNKSEKKLKINVMNCFWLRLVYVTSTMRKVNYIRNKLTFLKKSETIYLLCCINNPSNFLISFKYDLYFSLFLNLCVCFLFRFRVCSLLFGNLMRSENTHSIFICLASIIHFII